jgi:glycosyltransferase involved in cell wall biosynthesis
LNGEKFLEEAVDSVLAQSYPDWELLLVDDGSNDTSAHIAHPYVGRFPDKVRYLNHDNHHNRSASASRNLGNNSAKGELIAFLDADDVWLPHKLERQVEIMRKHPDALVYGLTQYCTDGPEKPRTHKRTSFLSSA